MTKKHICVLGGARFGVASCRDLEDWCVQIWDSLPKPNQEKEVHFEDFFQVRSRRRTFFPSSLSPVHFYRAFQNQNILLRSSICFVFSFSSSSSFTDKIPEAVADATVLMQIEVVALSNFEEKEDQFKQQASSVHFLTFRARLCTGLHPFPLAEMMIMIVHTCPWRNTPQIICESAFD